MKKIVLFFVLLSSIFMFACSKENNKMEIRGNDTIEVGFSSEYKVYYDNQVLSESEFYWIIDNTDVAARAGSTLYGLETGTVNIKAVLKEDPSIYVSKTVTIIESVVESISLRNAKSDVKVGDQFIVTILSEPSDAVYDVEAIWECDKDNIVADGENTTENKSLNSPTQRTSSSFIDSLQINDDIELDYPSSNNPSSLSDDYWNYVYGCP